MVASLPRLVVPLIILFTVEDTGYLKQGHILSPSVSGRAGVQTQAG